MTRALLAGFPGPESMTQAAREAREHGRSPLDAFTPYPIETLTPLLGHDRTDVPWWMLAGGLAMAALFFGTEWLSATRFYPFDQGGRPFASWPAFCVATVEISVLAAALTGFVVLLVKAGLPRLNHPLFDLQAFERASQDQFLLAIDLPADPDGAGAARQYLYDQGAVWIEEVEL